MVNISIYTINNVFSDGQGIGLRISNQFSQVVSKMKKELDIYNSYQDPPIELKSPLLPTSPLYNQLHSVNLTEQQQKAVEAKSLLSHAKEEKDILYKEMNVYSKYLVNQSSEILNNTIFLFLKVTIAVLP